MRPASIPSLQGGHRIPAGGNGGSPQGLPGRLPGPGSPVQSRLGAGLLKTLSDAEREGEDPIFKAHCSFPWGLL